MFVNRLGNLPLDLAAGGTIGDLSVGLWLAAKRDHALLLCDRSELKHLAIDGNIQPNGVTVPAQLFNKKFSEGERPDVFAGSSRIQHLMSVGSRRG